MMEFFVKIYVGESNAGKKKKMKIRRKMKMKKKKEEERRRRRRRKLSWLCELKSSLLGATMVLEEEQPLFLDVLQKPHGK
jgi:hypothetical protein